MPTDPTRIRISAWLMRSAETTGPIVVSDACSAIGPRAASRALTISPPLPVVGSSVLPVGGGGDAEPDGAGEPDAPADALGAGLALAVAAEAEADAPADALALGARVGIGVGVGATSARSIGSVLMSMNLSPWRTTIACRPFALNTDATWSAVTFGFSKRSCQVVPPV